MSFSEHFERSATALHSESKIHCQHSQCAQAGKGVCRILLQAVSLKLKVQHNILNNA